MRNDAPSLLPIFRSRHQADLLAEVLMHPGVEFGVAELSKRVGASPSTLLREVQRLVDAGLLRDRKLGRNRLVSANPANPATELLTQLIVPAFGPRVVIAELFSAVDDVEKVIIFGSWAARYAGVDGLPPNDIDVLVIGAESMSQLEVLSAANQAQRRLGIDVTPVLVTPDQWAVPGRDPLLAQIKHSPYVVAWQADEEEIVA
jgi:predicted nucleotidyltransferase